MPGSVRFYQYVDGGNQMGAMIDPGAAGYTVDEPTADSNTLLVSFAGADDKQINSLWVVFRTTLEGEMVDKEYTNDALFTSNGVDYPLHGSVTVNHGGSLVEKTGKQQSDGYVYWSATVNASQSTLEDAIITDTPSDNQRIDMNSLAVYATTVDAQGNIARGGALGKDAYTASYAQNGSGAWVLTLHVPGTLTTPLILEYRASVYLTSMTGTVSNTILVEGTNKGNGQEGSTKTPLNVRVFEGGGTIYGKQGSLTIRKIGADGNPLAGAVLALEDAKGNRIGPVTVPASGEIVFSNIVQGAYKLYELSAPEGYTVRPDLARGMEIQVTDNTTTGAEIVEVSNELTTASLRKVDEDGNPLAGAVFALEQWSDGADAYVPYGTETYSSGSDGIVRVSGLLPGRYQFVELTPPEGFLHNTDPREFTLSQDTQGVIAPQETGNYVNYRGTIRLRKVDDVGNPLRGAQFTLSRLDGTLVGTYASGPDGTVLITGIAPGEYILVETRAPIGYALTSDPRDITIPDTALGALPPLDYGNVVNNPALGHVILQKVDGVTLEGLEGAVFQLSMEGDPSVQLQITTNEDGYAQIDDLKPGNYTLTEITAPAGYIRNTAPWTFTITEELGASIDMLDIGAYANYKGGVRLLKENDEGEPLSGAVFTLSLGDTPIGAYTTNASGVIEIYGLAPGKYTLVEIRAPLGYATTSDPRVIEIPAETDGMLPPLPITIVNPHALGSVIFRKVDAGTGVGLEGAVFELLAQGTETVIRTITTNDTGWVQMNELEPGDYTLREIAAPAGYVLNTDTVDFTLTEDMSTSIDVLALDDIPNWQGRLRLTKESGAGEPLAGATFTLSTLAGDIIGTYMSGPDGVVEITGIAPGPYILRETIAPAGYATAQDPMRIDIPAEHAGELPEHDLGPIANTPVEGTIIFRKIDGDTDTGLPGATFEIVDAAGDLVATVTTNAYGWAQVDHLQPGDYTLRETVAPSGYLLNTQTWPFTVPEDAMGSIAPIAIGPVPNYQAKLSIEKIDEDGNPLPGATFTLYTQNERIINTYKTDATGVATIYQLAPGTYRIRETDAPAGYAVFTDPMDITIPDAYEGEPPVFPFGPVINERMMGVAIVHKVDAETNAPLAGAVFSLVNEDTHAELTRVVTGSDGLASVNDLASGHYAFVEVTAPYGYEVDHTPLTFEITDATQTAAVEVTSRNWRIPDSPATPRPTVPPDGPPKTGDSGNGPWVLLLAISGLALVGAIAVKLARRKPSR